MINIFRAKVTPDEFGYLVLDVTGTEENIRRGDFLLARPLSALPVKQGFQGLKIREGRP